MIELNPYQQGNLNLRKVSGRCIIDPSPPLIENMPALEISKLIQRDINCLGDESVATRKKAAIRLQRILCDQQQCLDHDARLELFATFSKPLFKRFNDSVEKVREVCIGLSILFIKNTNHDLMQILPYLIPAVINRTFADWQYDESQQVFVKDMEDHESFKRGRVVDNQGSFVNPYRQQQQTRHVVGEPSEEIRLSLCELIETLLENVFERKAASLLHPYFYGIVLFLVAGVNDPCPDITIKSCHVLEQLSQELISGVKFFAVGLVRAAKHLLADRHARVRIAALRAIQALVSCPNADKCKGAGTEAIVDLIGHRDENVLPIAAFYRFETTVNYFAKIDQDGSVQVRKVFYRMIADWLMNLPDRGDYESRLMPYLLSAIHDESSDEISKAALEAIDRLGIRYEKEHMEDVLERKQYGLDDDADAQRSCYSHPPFTERPRLGARLYVRSRCRRFINTLVKELTNWMSKTKLQAARLLKCIIVYSEEHVTMDLHVLIRAQIKVSMDPTIQEEMKQIAILTGLFVDPDAYLPLILPQIQAADSNAAARAVALSALGNMLRGTGSTKPKRIYSHLPLILDTISDWDLLRHRETSNDITSASRALTRYLLDLIKDGRAAMEAYYVETGRLVSLDKIQTTLYRTLLAVSDPSSTKLDVPQELVASILAQTLAAFPFSTLDGWTSTCPQQIVVERLLLCQTESIMHELCTLCQKLIECGLEQSVIRLIQTLMRDDKHNACSLLLNRLRPKDLKALEQSDPGDGIESMLRKYLTV